jgi:Ca-activated chloride channel homolog
LLAAALAGVAAIGAQTPAPPQTPPRFGAGTDVVIVDVLVTRDGKPVPGLTAADFTVTDAGVAQQIELAALDSVPVSLLLALDTSASVRGQPLESLKDAAKAAVASLRPTDQAALLTFSHNLALGAAWTDDRAKITQAIDAATAQGSTALIDAAFAAMGLRQRPGTRTLVLLFTDGDDSASWLGAGDVLAAARRSEAIVYGVTLAAPARATTPPDQLADAMIKEPGLYRDALLPVLAYETGGESLRAATAADLRGVFVDILSRFNNRYVFMYSPKGADAKGWHPITVKTKDPTMTVNARRGYTR